MVSKTNINSWFFNIIEGSFWVWAQSLRDDVTLQRRLSLAEHIPGRTPDTSVRKELTPFIQTYCDRYHLNCTEPRPNILCELTVYSIQYAHNHYSDVIMSAITGISSVYSTVFRCISKKSSKLRITGLCEGNSQVTSELRAQRASKAEIFPFDDVIMFCCVLFMFVVVNWSIFCVLVWFIYSYFLVFLHWDWIILWLNPEQYG